MTFLRKFMFCIAACLIWPVIAHAQWIERPYTGTSQNLLTDRTKMAGMAGMGPQFEVSLVDARKNAADKKAVVKVEVWGVDLVEPQSGQEPKLTQAYVTYQLDSGEIVRTVEDEHTFTDLAPGYHHIQVQLASLDGQPVGARHTVTVHVSK